jgi:hypothetical protein
LVKQNTETKSQSFEERIEQVQTKLSKIEVFLNKPENADKKLIHSTMLATLKGSLTNFPNLPSEKKEKALKDLEKEVKKLNQKLNLPDNPPVPNPDPTPPEETLEQLKTKATEQIERASDSSSSHD